MLHGLFIASLIGTCVQAIKESCAKPIPAENWANKELYHEDLMSGMSSKQLIKNVENGKYKLPIETYPEPHRMEDGRIIIENDTLYYEDIKRYGAYQAQQWVKQGKYNLTPEELEKKHEAHKARMERIYKML